MKLPTPLPQFDPTWQSRQNNLIEQADGENVKANRDNYMGDGRVILTAPDGTLWALTVSNTGVLGTETVPTPY